MIDIETIDWNEAWQQKKRVKYPTARSALSRDKRAPSFAAHSVKTGYAEAFFRIVNPKRSWAVFDMACGAGTLALTFARHVKSITAVDFSDGMLEILRRKCEQTGISNIRIVNGSREDDWGKAGIGLHDVVIASRSLVVDNLRPAIEKLHSFARRQVYISTIVGDGPHDRRLFNAVGRELKAGPEYIYNYNLLYQMGICANVDFITERNRATYKSPRDAFISQQWMFDDMTPKEELKLESYLKKHLVFSEGHWTLDYQRTIKWAVIWWNKE
ncbi:MAG TPA: class I SAM-dependent methyltransferase [Syntrophorhabdaceae bacterium]|nr:class I SAM-dependent methyltransferase [Syntrophorhabdaceae bacterium]